MADSFIRVAADGAGKKMQTVENTVGSDSVHAEAVLLVDENGDPIVTMPVSVAGQLNTLVLPSSISIGKEEDQPSFDGDVGSGMLAVRKATPANTSGTDGDYEFLQMSGGRLWVDASGKTLTVDSHEVTNAGTFAVQAAAADGANVTLGSKADAKSASTDTTAVSAMSVLKQISASVQAPPVLVVTNGGSFSVQATEADGTNETLGSRGDAKSPATDSTVITAMSVLKQISASVQAPPSQAVTQSGTWTVQPGNTANTTAWKVDASSVAVPVTDNSGNLSIDDGGNSITVDNNGTFAVQATGSVTANPTRSTTPTQTSVANSASNVTVVASNSNRLGATIFNDDTAGTGATLKLKLGATASSSSFTVAIAPQGYYEVPFGYTGIIDGIASAGTGNARITELTA